MLPAQVDPAFRGAFVGFLAAEVVTGFSAGLAGFLLGALTLDSDDGAAVRKAGSQWLGCTESYCALFDASVSAGALDKRGVASLWMRAYSRSVG